VPTFAIVEALDVVEHIHPGFASSSIVATVDAFAFEQCEEALDRSIVVAVAGAAHRTLDAMFVEQ